MSLCVAAPVGVGLGLGAFSNVVSRCPTPSGDLLVDFVLVLGVGGAVLAAFCNLRLARLFEWDDYAIGAALGLFVLDLYWLAVVTLASAMSLACDSL